MEKEVNQYLEAYYDNEADANKNMIFANAFAGIVLLVIWILYLTRVFPLYNNTFTLINIFFPINIIILFTPLLYLKSNLKKPTLKYFLVFSFIFVIAILNVIVPKHAIIGWAIGIVIVNHYYNPKLGLGTYLLILGLMLICLYLAMFVGEYDPNLLGSGIVVDGEIKYIYGIKERYDYLHNLLMNGNNRYLKVFTYYYISRAVLISIIFFVSNSLNRRTYNLLIKEIKINTEQSKTKTELDVAKDIQLATLPVDFLTSEDIEIQAELRPAKTVGGDFYDYYKLSDSKIAIVIGDVSGKGIPAAMFMMKAITCFKNYINSYLSPSKIMKEVNKAIFKNNESQMFVTCFLAIIDLETGIVTYSNAGHNHPIVGHALNYHYLDCQSGVMLGVIEDIDLVDGTYKLNSGDTITLYTDGITEARNDKGEFYGESRLINLFNKKEYSCLIELHHNLKDDIENFSNGVDQSDDLTYLTLKYHGDKYLYKEKLFNGSFNQVQDMLNFVNKFLKEQDIEQSFINEFMIVGDELFSNILKYGYSGLAGEIFIRILYGITQKELVLTIIDKGAPFNPFNIDNKPVSGEASTLVEGGLGILIVKNLMSEYAYDNINGKNIVTLKKKF